MRIQLVERKEISNFTLVILNYEAVEHLFARHQPMLGLRLIKRDVHLVVLQQVVIQKLCHLRHISFLHLTASIYLRFVSKAMFFNEAC